MNRDPSIHITKSALIKVLEDLGKLPIKSNPNWSHEWADFILNKGKQYSCASRSVYASNAKLEKKVEKLKLASRSDVGMFAQALLLVRRKLRHKGIRLISPNDADWLTLKEICKNATEFCNEFQISPKIGYREYISLAMGMMKNFSLYKFNSLHSPICNQYEAIQEINGDRSPDRTNEAHDKYVATISEKVGFASGYKDVPEKYVYFQRAADEAKRIGVPITTYMAAQFAAMDWRNGIPDPMQLVGSKAVQRVQQYCFENEIKIKDNSKPTIDFSKIKNHGKDNPE